VREGAVVRRLAEAVPTMTADLDALVSVESPSADVAATESCARVTEELAERLLGERPLWVRRDGRPHLLWRFGGPTRVLLLGHLDTVWPLGTSARWPFATAGDTATGPGCFDMKAGVVQLLWSLSCLDDLDGVTVLLTTDEEIGSPTSRTLIEDSARGAEATLVLEPSVDGALKTARKGISHYRLMVTGQAAHAGLEPHKGANAAVELAHQVLAVTETARAERGTTVTPTVLSAGSATNTVPAAAEAYVDVRVADATEQDRVDTALRSLVPRLAGTRVAVEGGANRPPMDQRNAHDLLHRARAVADRIGMPQLRGMAVGGASDGNFTAALGVPTLDGLGAVGDGAHAEGEHVRLAAMGERASLVALLVADLLGTPSS
jgi:glutamate carboxypeptidase